MTPPIRTPRPEAAAAAPARGPRLRAALAIGLATGLAAAGIVLGAGDTAGAAAQGSLPTGTQFYKDPNSQVARWVAANPGDSRQPIIARRIASQPQGIWFANYNPSTITSDVRTITSAAAAAGQVPVLAVYEIPNRDCGGASAGGAPDLNSYDAWVRNFAAGLGSGRSVVILEPDSVSLTTCLSAQQQSDRFASLSRAGAAIHAAAPNAKVYLDGGHSAWNSASEQANRLRSAGILNNADGFFTNVSNFNATSNEVNYAKNILSALGNPGNLHAVVDTSRNGNGPAGGGAWCDPSGRAIGTYPTASTGDAAIDAFLWVKPPGEADGCAGAAGTFIPDVAYQLASAGASDPTTGGTTGGTSTTGGSTTGGTTTGGSTTGGTTTGGSTTGGSTTGGTTTGGSTTGGTTTGGTTTGGTTTGGTNGGTGSNSCKVTFTPQSWTGGFTANVTVANTGSTAVNGWKVGFTLPSGQTVTSAWNATISPNSGTVAASSLSYNAQIPAGGSQSFGFQGAFSGSYAQPTAFTLNGAACAVS